VYPDAVSKAVSRFRDGKDVKQDVYRLGFCLNYLGYLSHNTVAERDLLFVLLFCDV